MDVITLQSGSSGNCVFVRSGDTRLLFDAGISGVKAEERLSEFGYDIRDCDAVVLSHEHSDHVSGVGVFHRKFGLPIYASLRTWDATLAKPSTGHISTANHFVSGESFQIGTLRIETLRTPHDAVDGVCFVIEDTQSRQRFGLLTDLGHVFSGLRKVIATLDAVLIESNYDDDMLRHGAYPQHLKKRILGKGGHISNDDAAELLDRCDGRRLQWACLGHLSAENNSPEVAMATHLDRHGHRFPIICADRNGATQMPSIQKKRSKTDRPPCRLMSKSPTGR
jgi:phosphoribosyl 1,2-cyclic phosphodiesterase